MKRQNVSLIGAGAAGQPDWPQPQWVDGGDVFPGFLGRNSKMEAKRLYPSHHPSALPHIAGSKAGWPFWEYMMRTWRGKGRSFPKRNTTKCTHSLAHDPTHLHPRPESPDQQEGGGGVVTLDSGVCRPSLASTEYRHKHGQDDEPLLPHPVQLTGSSNACGH